MDQIDLLGRYRSYWRFALVGCSNTAVDFGVFTFLQAVFQLNYILCQVAAFIAGISNSFILNKMWTFESKTTHFDSSIQFTKFVIVNLVSLGMSLVGLKLLNGNLAVNIYLAKVAVTVVTQAVNYSGYRFWVFSDKNLFSKKNICHKI